MKQRARAAPSRSAAAPRRPFFSRAGSFFSHSGIQAKLRIGAPGDRFEVEADRVADQVVATGTAPSVQRMCAGCADEQPGERELRRQPIAEEEREEEVLTSSEAQLSMKARPGGPRAGAPAADSASAPSPGTTETEVSGLRGSGQSLPGPARAFFERSFGLGFDHVRVHTDERAARLASALDARAFTYGSDVVFGRGEYRPGSADGDRLLAHELTHVVQQQGAVRRVMRSPACDCSRIGRAPTASESTAARSLYPNLVDGDWCVTGEATATYNCIAWSVGDTSKWIWDEVDSTYGDNDGTVSISDFDAFYGRHGLSPVANSTPSDPEVALFAKGGSLTHAARISAHSCGGFTMFESKRGPNIRIVHDKKQLEGGYYGDIIRYYVPKASGS